MTRLRTSRCDGWDELLGNRGCIKRYWCIRVSIHVDFPIVVVLSNPPLFIANFFR